MTPIDIAKLKADINDNAHEIRKLKNLRDESHQPHWTGAYAKELRDRKENATLMCGLRARARGRKHLHFRSPGEELAFNLALDDLSRYYLPVPAPAVHVTEARV